MAGPFVTVEAASGERAGLLGRIATERVELLVSNGLASCVPAQQFEEAMY